MKNLKSILYSGLSLFVLFTLFTGCGSNTTTEEYEIPSQGVETVLQEVQPEQFKITDENVLADTSASTVIANYLSGEVDTFSLAEVRLMQTSGTSSHRSIARMASFGLFGYMMTRNMRSHSPRASAYMDQKTYSKVNNNAGKSMRTTASRSTRTVKGGKSGFGSKSSRSYGG